MEAPLNVMSLKPWGGARTGTAAAAAARPMLMRLLTMHMMSSAVSIGVGVEEAMLVEVLEEAKVAMAEGADAYGSLGGWLDASTAHTPEGGVLAPKPISVGRIEAVAGVNGMVTTGGTGHPLEPPGGRELWAWAWEMKPGWAIRSWE